MKTQHFFEWSGDQRRQLVDAESLFDALEGTSEEAFRHRGTMFWREQGGDAEQAGLVKQLVREYLPHLRLDEVSGTTPRPCWSGVTAASKLAPAGRGLDRASPRRSDRRRFCSTIHA